MKVQELFRRFNDLNILVIGDVMLDAYVWGNVSRISPEAPVPVVQVKQKENRPGGAANVALNVQALGANAILCTVIGNDDGGKTFVDLLLKRGLTDDGVVKSKGRITTIKTRIIGNNHQMLRVDEEVETTIDKKETETLLLKINHLLKSKKIDAIIFEDYDKGCISPLLIEEVVKTARQKKIPTIVDPKKRNFMAYKGVTLFKPNLKELKEGLKHDFETNNKVELKNAVTTFLKNQGIEQALITLSEKGIYIHTAQTQKIIPAHIRNISDVSGAGDTVVSVAALCNAVNLDAEKMATLANLAGGLVCEKVGVVPVDKEQLLREAISIKL